MNPATAASPHPQWLRSFSALVAHASFTRAADHLGVTQAAVSQHVRKLEQMYGPLLIRRPRRLELTPAGQALLAYCRELEQAHTRLQRRMDSRDAHEGEVAVITPGSIGLFLYPRLLALQQAHPGLVIRHRFAPDSEVLAAVREQRYELGLVTLRPEDDALRAWPFLEEALELVHPAGTRPESWSDLQGLGFIDHPDGLAMANRLLARLFPGNPGLDTVPVSGFCNQIGLILEPVARGLGFTVIPTHARQAFHQPESIAVLQSAPPLVDTLWWIHRAEWPLSARAACVIEGLHGEAPPN